MNWIDTNGLWGDVPPQSLQSDGHCCPLPRNPHQQLRKHTCCCSGEIPLTSVSAQLSLLVSDLWGLYWARACQLLLWACWKYRRHNPDIKIQSVCILSMKIICLCLSQWLDQNLELGLSGSCRLAGVLGQVLTDELTSTTWRDSWQNFPPQICSCSLTPETNTDN